MAGKKMTDKQRMDEQHELTDEELEQQQAAELPDREATSLVNANLAAPINLAAALNVLSDANVSSGFRVSKISLAVRATEKRPPPRRRPAAPAPTGKQIMRA